MFPLPPRFKRPRHDRRTVEFWQVLLVCAFAGAVVYMAVAVAFRSAGFDGAMP